MRLPGKQDREDGRLLQKHAEAPRCAFLLPLLHSVSNVVADLSQGYRSTAETHTRLNSSSTVFADSQPNWEDSIPRQEK